MSGRIWSGLLVCAAVAAVIGLLVVVVDIGGEDSSGEEERAATDAPSEVQDGKGQSGASAQGDGASSKDGRNGEKNGEGSAGRSSDGKTSTREEIAKIPAADRQSFAQTAGRNALNALGLPGSTITVTEDGYTVFVAIPQQYACGVDASKVEEIKRELERIIITARQFRLNVQSAGPLAEYVRTQCRDLVLPDAGGPVVYSKSASGTQASDELKIRSRRWTVAYQNGGGELDITVAKGQDIVKPRIKSTRYEVGKATYRGPGTFRVIATSAARWKVRVYDGT